VKITGTSAITTVLNSELVFVSAPLNSELVIGIRHVLHTLATWNN
jgi:hypothetical protein